MYKLKNLMAVALISLCAGLSHQTIASPKAAHEALSPDAAYQKNILHYINEYRAQHHLSPLKLVNPISVEATIHSRNMASKKTPVAHEQFNARIQRLYKEIKDCRGGAENVAYWRSDAKKVVDGWMASPGHRRNILGHYNLTGIGVAQGRTGWAYFTQIFLRSDDKRYT